MQNLTVTLVQADLAWEDPKANLQKFDTLLAGLAGQTQVVILPEMFATGFTMRAAEFAESMDGRTVTWMRQKAQQLGADLVGSAIIAEQGKFYNRLLWVRPGGEILHYDKRHLFRLAGEERAYTAGNRRLIVTVDGWKILPLICYDLRFPVWCRNQHNEYDAAIFVANWPQKRVAHWTLLLRARAVENQAFVLGVNRVGYDGNGYYHTGDSMTIDPMGQVLWHKKDEEAVGTVTLEAEALKQTRERLAFWMDADRFRIE